MNALPDSLLRAAEDLMESPPSEIENALERGSDRTYTRLVFPGGQSLIASVHGVDRPENASFVQAASLARDLGLSVPTVYAYCDEERWVLQEDLGRLSLYDFVKAHGFSPSAREITRQVLSEVAILHRDGATLAERRGFQPQPGFTESLYRWETDYFCDNLGGLFLKEIWPRDDLEEEFRTLREALLALPMGLLHRDLQSQNILVSDGKGFLIDLQGMRMGPGLYDVASLLEDPYTCMSSDNREDLLVAYASYCGEDRGSYKTMRTYHYAACQRLMQALGAFSLLGIKKGKREYLGYIVPGLEALVRASTEARLGALREIAGRSLERTRARGFWDLQPGAERRDEHGED